MFDKRGLLVYQLIGVGFALDFAAVLALGFTVTPAALALFWSWPFLAIAGMLARRIGLNRVALMLEGIALMYGIGLALLLVVYGLAAISGPYADGMLARWDEALGFHWPSYAKATLPFTDVLVFAYRSFAWQPFLIVVILVIADRSERLWQLILATLLVSALGAVIFPFFPAEGVFKHYGFIPPGLEDRVTYRFASTLDYLREGGRTIEPKILTGLVSFPSYHTVQALLFTWAAWCHRGLRWPMLAFNTVVLVSIPVIGAHYLVDMIAGAAIAAFAIMFAKKLQPESSQIDARNTVRQPALV